MFDLAKYWRRADDGTVSGYRPLRRLLSKNRFPKSLLYEPILVLHLPSIRILSRDDSTKSAEQASLAEEAIDTHTSCTELALFFDKSWALK